MGEAAGLSKTTKLALGALALATAGLVWGAAGFGSGSVFDLEALPVGKNITIPRPATTFVPLDSRVTLTATDMPQSVSITPVHRRGAAAKPVKISIYDRESERVKYVDLTPGTPFLYNFLGLTSITILAEGKPGPGGGAAGRNVDKNAGLQIESDKPLEIAR